MSGADLAYTPATELARRIRSDALSPVEVVENCIAWLAVKWGTAGGGVVTNVRIMRE